MTTAHPTSPVLVWTFRWDLREHARALRAVSRHAASARWVRPLLRIGFGAGLLVVVMSAVVGSPAAYDLGTWIVLIALWVLLFRWMGPWLGAWQTRRNDPAAQSEIRQSADDDGITVHCPGQDVRLAWSGIARVVETNEFFLVYFQRAGAYYAPKRAIEPEHVEELRALFRRELGIRAEVLGGGITVSPLNERTR